MRMIAVFLLFVSCSAGVESGSSRVEAPHPEVLFWGRIPAAEVQFLRLLEDSSPDTERALGEVYARTGHVALARVFGAPGAQAAGQRECPERSPDEGLIAATELWDLEITPVSPQALVANAESLFDRHPDSCHVAVQWASALLNAATQGAEVDPRNLERANRTYLTAVASGILPMGTLDLSDAFVKSMLLFESLGEYDVSLRLARGAQQALEPDAFEREFRSDYLEAAVRRYESEK